MPELPPWLRISPDTFQSALQSGAALGLQIARMRQQAEESRNSGRVAPPQVDFNNGGGRSAPPAIQSLRGPGFSPDGLSYAVDKDPGAIAANDAAKEEARLKYNATNYNNPLVDKAANPPILSPAQVLSRQEDEYQLGQKLKLQHDEQKARKDLLDAKINKPILRTVNGAIVSVDPDTLDATPLITLPSQSSGHESDVKAVIRALTGGGSGPQAANQPAASIPDAAIAKLKSNPGLKADFDAKYGAGSADRVLSSKVPTAAESMGFQF